MSDSCDMVCLNCGGPMTLQQGQTLSFETTATFDANGAVVEYKQTGGWCPSCIDNWDERITMAGSEVHVYSVGYCYASVCVPKDLASTEIERRVNQSNPTGIDSTWHIANEPFHTGHPNPCPCEHDPNRQHWLLSC